MTPKERGERVAMRFSGITFSSHEDVVDWISKTIAAESQAAVEDAFAERGHLFQDAIQKCLEEKRQARAEAYEDAAKIVETSKEAEPVSHIAAKIRARAKEL